MPIDLKIPSLGESISEVQISQWLKAEGDTVKKDESVAVIDSEKSTLELPSPESGHLVKILHQAGEVVKIGDAVAQIETAGNGSPSEPEKKAPPSSKAEVQEEKHEPVEIAANPVPQPSEEQPVHQPDLTGRGSAEEQPVPVKPPGQPAVPKLPAAESFGEDARKSKQEAGVNPKRTGRAEEVVPMTMLRRTVARRLVEAKQQMAMLTTFNEVDMSAVQSLRQTYRVEFEERYQIKFGLMGFFVKAVIDALKQFPQLNAEVRENDIVYRNYSDIGVAIASGRGLVVPVLRNAERMSFAEVESAVAGFARRAKDGQLKPDELEGGTFTITNGGVFGSLLSTPIINPPQTGILGMHTIQERPIALQGQVVIRPMMYLALTYDHRVVDGREAVLFLRRMKESIETPSRMLVEI